MAKFLTFETTAVKLNDSIFPSNSATFGLQAATVPVFDINGNLIDYAPNGPIQGKFSTEFYLTGALPNYLKFDNQSDAPISVSFNNFNIPSAFLTDLSFSVEPYQPISVSASFDFYHGIISLSTDLNDTHNLFSPADGTNKVKNQLATLNGLSSYIITYDRSTYKENPDDFIVSNFSYSFTVDRQPLLRVKQSIPSRVALKQVNGQFSITSNNIDGLLDIHGNDAIFNAILADPQNPATYTSIGLTGIITDQNYVISDSNYGVGTIKMVQSITKKRNAISVPETNDPAIVEVSPPNVIIDIPVGPVPPKPPMPPPPELVQPVVTPTPPTPPPELDPNLIWFNVYATIYDINNLCYAPMYTHEIFAIAAANNYDSIVDNKQYKIEKINLQKLVKVDPNSVLKDYFLCSFGVNKNVLESMVYSNFPTFENTDECSVDGQPLNSADRKLALQARFTDYQPEYNSVTDSFVCKILNEQYNNSPSVICYTKRIYATWSYLIPFMKCTYDADISVDPTKKTFEIKIPMSNGRAVLNNYICQP